MSAASERWTNTVREVRRAQKLTQSELASKSGVSRVTIYNVETGRATASPETMWKLAQTLKVPVGDLFTYIAGGESAE